MDAHTRESIELWLETLDCAPLECDGLSRCISTLLSRHQIEHVVHQGVVEVEGVGAMHPHYWIELHDGQLIDLRARMWLGQNSLVPHGLFSPDACVEYNSSQLIYAEDFNLHPDLFHILSGFDLDSFTTAPHEAPKCSPQANQSPSLLISPSDSLKAPSPCAPG